MKSSYFVLLGTMTMLGAFFAYKNHAKIDELVKMTKAKAKDMPQEFKE